MRLGFILAALFFTLQTFAQSTTLVLVGGGDRPAGAIEAFVSATHQKPILVLPWGSTIPDEYFESIKTELLAHHSGEVIYIRPPHLATLDREALVAQMKNAGGIWFPGGDQTKIMAFLREYRLVSVIQNLFAAGRIAVGGSSAGTAIQSARMMTGKGSQTAKGLGLLKGYIVDQHFFLRNREARLLGALAIENDPTLKGMGVDENMSIIIRNGTELQAIGPTQVGIYQLKPNAKPTDRDAYSRRDLHNLEEALFKISQYPSAKNLCLKELSSLSME